MKNTTIKPRGKFFKEFEDQQNFSGKNSNFMTRMSGARNKNIKNDRIVAKYFGETEENVRK